ADMLFHLLKILAALFLVAMIVMVFGNVVLRYAFNSGITVSEELSSWCLTWMTYTAGLVALRDHGHLGFDGVLKKMPAGVQKLLLCAAQVIMIGFMAIFGYGSWQQTIINLENMAPASGLSQGLLYGIGIVFSVGAIFVLLADLIKIATGQLTHTLSSEADEAMAEIEELHETEHLKH
ncbi:TRAP transporter small permease, partial [Propionivibrio limicola]|uniref:TRAP transporter small permease n=1 Tax=Propionivibrio limicola TaxID=167645 RepID=UPI001291AFC7